MQLHEFMCPQVFGSKVEDFLDDLSLAHYASDLVFAWKPDESKLYFRNRSTLVERTEEINSVAFGSYKSSRNFNFFKSLAPRSKIGFISDMEDCRAFDPMIYLQRDLNVFQYNRRVGSRSAVLWRLPGYFEPSTRMGSIDGETIQDQLRLRDKVPKIFWRGELSGSRWVTPYRRTTAGAVNTYADLKDLARIFSRPNAVLYSMQNREFTDFRFVGAHAENIVGIQAENIGSKSPPSEFLKYRYILCPSGNDVATNLYWVIKTRSLAFKEDCDYEVLPDYFLKPWVHYVPISKGLHDLKEKFEYCEQNPAYCERIVENANIAYLKMIDKKMWEASELIVLDRLGII